MPKRPADGRTTASEVVRPVRARGRGWTFAVAISAFRFYVSDCIDKVANFLWIFLPGPGFDSRNHIHSAGHKYPDCVRNAGRIQASGHDHLYLLADRSNP